MQLLLVVGYHLCGELELGGDGPRLAVVHRLSYLVSVAVHEQAGRLHAGAGFVDSALFVAVQPVDELMHKDAPFGHVWETPVDEDGACDLAVTAHHVAR